MAGMELRPHQDEVLSITSSVFSEDQACSGLVL